MLRAIRRGCMGSDEERKQEKGWEAVEHSHGRFVRRVNLDRSIAGPFHTIKANFFSFAGADRL
jgi:hypothetical protein